MAPNMVSISLPVGLLVSSIRWPPIESTTKAMPRFSRSPTMSSRLRVERARRSGFVTTSTSPSRTNLSSARAATEDTCSAKIFSQPAAFRSRLCAARPAACSTVFVQAYPPSIGCSTACVLIIVIGMVPILASGIYVLGKLAAFKPSARLPHERPNGSPPGGPTLADHRRACKPIGIGRYILIASCEPRIFR
jgi:hypothetical protein